MKKAAVPKDGWTLYYTNQCPHTAKYVPVLVDAAAERGIKIQPVQDVYKRQSFRRSETGSGRKTGRPVRNQDIGSGAQRGRAVRDTS